MKTSQKVGPQVSARDFLPTKLSLGNLRRAAADCKGCPLYQNATQTVFGEGSADARLMLLGEQPGDAEDRERHPFVGPAGRLLREMLAEVGIDFAEAYVTNAVKHFKWTPRGKRRLHAKPNSREVNACRPWLQAEIEVVNPMLIICLGATAAQSLLGSGFRVSRERGKIITKSDLPPILATYHPSALLRAPDEASRRAMRRDFTADLRRAAGFVELESRRTTRKSRRESV
jgi:DNA polymerase